jgi:hypothetical protein
MQKAHVKIAYEKDNSLFPQATYWQVLYNLGNAYQNAGSEENAQKVWSQLLEITADQRYKNLVHLKNKI